MCFCSFSCPACNVHTPYHNVVWPARLYHIFPHFLINATVFGEKKVIGNKIFLLSLQLLSQIFLILIRRYIIINVHRSSCKVPAIFVKFSSNFTFLDRFRKILDCHILWKSLHYEPSCSMRTHGRIDIAKLITAFRNFA